MKFIKTLPYKLQRTLPILGIAGASLLAGCNKDDEPTPPGLHDTVYTWNVDDMSRILPPTDICMSADSANVNRVILQNTDKSGQGYFIGELRDIFENQILEYVSPENQHKVRGRGEIRGYMVDRGYGNLTANVNDSLWLVHFGFVLKSPVSVNVNSKQR